MRVFSWGPVVCVLCLELFLASEFNIRCQTHGLIKLSDYCYMLKLTVS